MSSTTSSSIAIASTTTIEGLAREGTIARALIHTPLSAWRHLNESNLLHDHLLGSVHTLRRTTDDKVLLSGIRRCGFVNLSVGSARLVDALDRLTTLANDQPNLARGHHHILRLLPLSSPSKAATSTKTTP